MSDTHYPVIDPSKCDGCGDCVPVCDESVFEMAGGKAKVVDPSACLNGCYTCIPVCEDGAISMGR